MPQSDATLFHEIDLALSENPALLLCEISRNFGVDRHNVERAVRIHAGTTFREFKKCKLLEKAANLLEAGYYVKEVAAMLGYRSPEAFTRFVKTATGKTPRSLRQSK
jgi:AraC-like DNA-binding protein